MSETPESSSTGSEGARAPLLAWRSEYSLGIPDVDHEHRELFDLINERTHASSSPGPERR